MKENAVFKVGDSVTWSSQANGRTITKIGKIISVVPPLKAPFRLVYGSTHYALPDGQEIPFSRTNYGGGLPRGHESYVVSVDNGKAYYWPLVSKLRPYNDRKYVLKHTANGYLQNDLIFTQDINEATIMSLEAALEKCRAYNQKEPLNPRWKVVEAVVGLIAGPEINV